MRLTSAAALVLVLLLSACGGGGDQDDAEAPAAGAEPTATEPKVGGGLSLADGSEEPAAPTDAAEATDAADAVDPTEQPTEDAEPTDDAVAEASEEAPAGPPTEGLPGGRYVEIGEITADGQSYAVEFTPYNFEPFIGSGPEDFHVHFFFDDIAPENAGTNGPDPGDWFLYDGGSPFTGYTFADRPPAATRMCALVADAAHGVTVGTGNCVTLP